MISILRSDSNHSDFIALVKLLDDDLAFRDGKDHFYYSQYNKIDKVRYVVIAYENEIPVGCGALKEFKENTMEIKRMFVVPEYRKKGIASLILNELERWTAELSYSKCVLETGKKQPEAIALYTKNGYKSIPNYGQYVGINNSLCFEKKV